MFIKLIFLAITQDGVAKDFDQMEFYINLQCQCSSTSTFLFDKNLQKTYYKNVYELNSAIFIKLNQVFYIYL